MPSKHYPAESSGRAGAGGGVGAPSAAAGGVGAGAAAGPAEQEISPKLTASALQHLQPSLPSPAFAAFEAREVPEGLPSAKQGGTYWGKVGVLGAVFPSPPPPLHLFEFLGGVTVTDTDAVASKEWYCRCVGAVIRPTIDRFMSCNFISHVSRTRIWNPHCPASSTLRVVANS